MRSKHIIAIAAFFTCFALSSFLVGLLFPKNTTYEIVNVRSQAGFAVSERISILLQQDEEYGDERDAAERSSLIKDESFPRLAVKSIIYSEYAENSASINDNDLPHDFQIAWRKHMQAWADYSEFLRKAENAGMSVESIKRVESEYESDVNTTWYQVLRVASSYGAEFPE